MGQALHIAPQVPRGSEFPRPKSIQQNYPSKLILFVSFNQKYVIGARIRIL